MYRAIVYGYFFFFNDTATTEIYTLSLHDALPIYRPVRQPVLRRPAGTRAPGRRRRLRPCRGAHGRAGPGAGRRPRPAPHTAVRGRAQRRREPGGRERDPAVDRADGHAVAVQPV